MTRTIRAAVLTEAAAPIPYAVSRPLTIAELELDSPGPHELLVRIEVAGICHSDLSVVDGSRPRPTPIVLGHEAAGIVEEVGADVEDLSAGQRVVMTFLPRCGNCHGCGSGGRMPCENGSAANTNGTLLSGMRRLHRGASTLNHHLGVSAFAEYVVVDRRSVVAVGDDVPAEVAALLGCAALTGGGAVLNVAPPTRVSTVAVVGLGGVGMAALLVARSLEPEFTIAVDALPAKLQRARELGADLALSPDEALIEGIRADLVIEAAGHPAAFETAVAITAPGGTTVTVGLPNPAARSSISPLTLTAEARTIVGSYLGSAVPERDIPKLAQLWREGRLPLEQLISSWVTLDEINEAMDCLADGTEMRQMIDLSGQARRFVPQAQGSETHEP